MKDAMRFNHNEGDVLITKLTLAREVNNDKCHNFYFEARFRIYTGKTHYFKGNFVVWFDTDDLAEEYPNKGRFSKKDIRGYAETLAYSFMGSAPRKNVNAKTMKPFYEECRFTVMDYNEKLRAA